MKQDPTERDHARHPADSAKEKVERDLPSPDRRFYHRLAVVIRFSRNWTAGYVNPAGCDNTVLPRLLAQLFKPPFGWRVGGHEYNANAARVAMVGAIAVPKAAAQA